MGMSDAEKQALKALAHYLIDQAEPAIIDAELAKISNPQILAVAKILEASLLPLAIKAQDAKVDSL